LRDRTPLIIPFKDLVEEVISYGVLSPRSKVFIRELLIFAEERNTEAILLRRELREKDAILNTRKTRKTGRDRGPYYPFESFYLKRGRKSRGSYKSEKDRKREKKKDYCFIEFRE
jgi:hypothetical protein